MVYVLLPPQWLREVDPSARPFQVQDDLELVLIYNEAGYNAYYYPNYPSVVQDLNKFIQGDDIDTFEWVFVDFDLKSGTYPNKNAFIESLSKFPLTPTRVVDSGGGIHSYWHVSDLSSDSYLRLQRRLARLLSTDTAIAQIKQLMRLPGTFNTKIQDEYRPCQELFYEENIYTCEQLDKLLPPITLEDEEHCIRHFNTTYRINSEKYCIDDKIPLKFAHLLKNSPEVKKIWSGNVEDRSKGDYRLGHIMFASSFTKDEATSVLVNSAKALSRTPVHRISYAKNIVDKIWTFEITQDKGTLGLSSSVMEILSKAEGELEGTPFRCHSYIDDTEVGFRLGHVMGLCAGSGVGKTAMALNLFMGFVESNPDYVHFFCSLEQPKEEIAARWKRMCGDNTRLHSKVQIMSNQDNQGNFLDLSLADIRAHILEFQQKTGKKVGCVVIDHIGVLCNNNKFGHDAGLKQICKEMKAFALEAEIFLIMQSQVPREKAGIGDLELNKDAAFGTSAFENFSDYIVVLWQPLKRMYREGAPTVMAYKLCKIRHKRQGVDKLLEDVPYALMFDPATERVREITQKEAESLPFWVSRCTNKRKQDRRTDIVVYTSIEWSKNAEKV